jgi:DNA-binding Lrp family transcriptional regulator
MKKIALISTFCNTPEKVHVLIENVKTLKFLGVDVMVNSFIPLEPEVINHFDFYFQTKENPILRWPERAFTFWWKHSNHYGKEIMLHRDVDDYGWAAVYQMKKLSEIALTFDYDIFYHITYDVVISDELTQDILDNKSDVTYHVIDPNDSSHKWNVTPLFLILSKENLIKFLSKIDKDQYIQRYGFAEDFIELLLEDIPMTKSEFPVKDSITHISGRDGKLFNYSQSENYKIFFSNKTETHSDGWIDQFSFVVYDIKEGDLKIVLNDKEIYNIENLVPQRFEINVNSFKVIFNDEVIEYNDIINDIPRNVIN